MSYVLEQKNFGSNFEMDPFITYEDCRLWALGKQSNFYSLASTLNPPGMVACKRYNEFPIVTSLSPYECTGYAFNSMKNGSCLSPSVYCFSPDYTIYTVSSTKSNYLPESSLDLLPETQYFHHEFDNEGKPRTVKCPSTTTPTYTRTTFSCCAINVVLYYFRINYAKQGKNVAVWRKVADRTHEIWYFSDTSEAESFDGPGECNISYLNTYEAFLNFNGQKSKMIKLVNWNIPYYIQLPLRDSEANLATFYTHVSNLTVLNSYSFDNEPIFKGVCYSNECDVTHTKSYTKNVWIENSHGLDITTGYEYQLSVSGTVGGSIMGVGAEATTTSTNTFSVEASYGYQQTRGSESSRTIETTITDKIKGKPPFQIFVVETTFVKQIQYTVDLCASGMVNQVKNGESQIISAGTFGRCMQLSMLGMETGEGIAIKEPKQNIIKNDNPLLE
jgi:hypothetical protein